MFTRKDDLTSLGVDELKAYAGEVQARIDELKAENRIASITEAKQLKGHLQTVTHLASVAEADLEDLNATDDVQGDETKADDEVAKDDETTKGAKDDIKDEIKNDAPAAPPVDVAPQVVAPDANTLAATESEQKASVVVEYADKKASADAVRDAVAQVKNSKDQKVESTFATKRLTASAYEISETSNAEVVTSQIMAVTSPQFKDPSKNQKRMLASVNDCLPAEEIRPDLSCGTYRRAIADQFRQLTLRGTSVTFAGRFDPKNIVNIVDTSQQPINKICPTLECATPVTLTADEVSACFSVNEQTAFSSDLAVQGLINDLDGLVSAKMDTVLLAKLDAQATIVSYAAGNSGYRVVYQAIGAALQQIAQASPLYDVTEGWVAFLPQGLLNMLVASEVGRQFSTGDTVAILDSIRRAYGVDFAIYSDAIDPAITGGTLVNGQPLVAATNYAVRLVRPDDWFLGTRPENTYGVNEIAPSITELKKNEVSYFGRAYELLGKVGCNPNVTIQLSDLTVCDNACGL